MPPSNGFTMSVTDEQDSLQVTLDSSVVTSVERRANTPPPPGEPWLVSNQYRFVIGSTDHYDMYDILVGKNSTISDSSFVMLIRHSTYQGSDRIFCYFKK